MGLTMAGFGLSPDLYVALTRTWRCPAAQGSAGHRAEGVWIGLFLPRGTE